MKSIEQSALDAKGLRIAIVAARWNDTIVSKLIDGSIQALKTSGLDESDIYLYRVPGSYELPLVVQRCAESKRFDAVIALGAVIRGDTFHFEIVSTAASDGVLATMLKTGVPCIFGVLTTDTMSQALSRAAQGMDNKGYEAALAAIEMVQVLRSIS